MTLAHRLAQQGKRVTLIEAASHLGGLASAWSLGDVVWDRHYHVTLLSDAHLRKRARGARSRARDRVDRDPHRRFCRRPAVLGVQHARVAAFSGARLARRDASRGHDPLGLAVAGLAAPRGHPRRRLAHALVGPRAPSSASGCRCCAPSSAMPTPRPRPRSSGRRSSASTRRGAPA